MRQFISKPETMIVGEWNGQEDEPIVTELRESGWSVLFQNPAEGQKVQDYNEESGEWSAVPAPTRMVIVGPYRNQVFNMDAGETLIYSEDSPQLRTGRRRDLSARWDEIVGTRTTWPTPDDLYAHRIENPDLF